MVRSARDTIAFDGLSELKRHLRSCRYCMAAKKANDPLAMCVIGIRLTWKAAMQYDNLIRLRTIAHNNPGGVIYACPDLSKHGKDYSLTASPYHAVGVQDRLF
jgi:hypothetical protein